MSLDGEYDPDNIFAKIVRGEAPAAKVYEDHDTLAFMDVFPQGRGHVLVVHKRSHARNLLDVDPQDMHAVMTSVQRVARAVRAALKPDGIFIAQFNGAVSGQVLAMATHSARLLPVSRSRLARIAAKYLACRSVRFD